MVQSIFNHIHGKIGSRWAKFIKETGIDHMLIVGIDAAKLTHKAVVSTFHGDVLVQPQTGTWGQVHRPSVDGNSEHRTCLRVSTNV